MTNPTDAMRAECEQALREHTGLKEGDEGLNGETAQGFRAGFNVLAAEVAALRAGREEDARLRLFVEAIRDTTTMPGEATLRATARAVLTGAAVSAARVAGKGGGTK